MKDALTSSFHGMESRIFLTKRIATCSHALKALLFSTLVYTRTAEELMDKKNSSNTIIHAQRRYRVSVRIHLLT